MLGHQPLHRSSSDPAFLAVWEKWVVGYAAALTHPTRQHGGGLLPKGCGPVLAAFAHAADVRSGAEFDVASSSAGQLRDPQASSTATSIRAWSAGRSRSPGRGSEKGVRPRAVKVGQLVAVGPLGGDGQDRAMSPACSG